ncbi:MAG: response regulator [Patescibacteria group bacterium]|nr:response regulator [Patescibacteria group bacterium]
MKKILLVEDEKLIREMYIFKLENEGFEIFEAINIKEAERVLNKKKIDLMILDILLSKENGLDYLERLQKGKREVPTVIVMSNLEGHEYRERAKELNAKDYFLKTSYVPSEIVGLVKKYL